MLLSGCELKVVRPRRVLLHLACNLLQILSNVGVAVLPEQQPERRVRQLGELVDLLDTLLGVAPPRHHDLRLPTLAEELAEDSGGVRLADVRGVLGEHLELLDELGDEAARQDGRDLWATRCVVLALGDCQNAAAR